MTAADFAAIERLWNEVADAAPADRARLLAAASDDVRREVESLLAADAEAGDFLHAPARRETIEQGTRIGPYEIVSLLGSGGMGEVYRARDARLGRDVALKILAPDLWDSATAAARFAREARAASALNHRNIVHVYDVATEPTPFIAMELVEGETLRQKIRDRADLPSILGALVGAARGLARAHAAGIVHRDLKPENIMITPEGEAKLLDFGLAKVTDVARADRDPSLLTTRAGLVVGTVGYMSPEQAQGERIDHRSDVFSFGCILFEAAAGRRPFESDSLIDTLHKIVHAPVPSMRQWNAALPRRLQTLVERCLEKKPDARYQSMNDVALALEDVLRRDARALSLRRASRWTRAAAAAAVAALCGLGLHSAAPLRTNGTLAFMSLSRNADTQVRDRALVRAETTSPRAHDAFLRGRHEWNRWTEEGWLKAIGFFEEATIADPLFASAYAGLSDSYTQLALYGFMPPEEAWPNAKAAALKALELDETLGEAHMSLAVVRTWYEWDFAAAEEGYARAIELSPRFAEAHLAYAMHLGVAGSADQAVVEAQRAVQLNPVSAITQRALADVLMVSGDLPRYEAQAHRLIGLHPDDPVGHYHLALAAQRRGREEEAFRHMRRYDEMYEIPPAQIAAREAAFRSGGMRGYWLAMARDGEAAGEASITLAVKYTLGGDHDRALHWIERGIERRDPFILWSRTYPMFAPLRGAPRYEALMARMAPGA